MIPRRISGPTAARDPPTRATTVGRMVFRRRQVQQALERMDGTPFANQREAARALLDTRRHIWFEGSATHGDEWGIMEAYTQENGRQGHKEVGSLCQFTALYLRWKGNGDASTESGVLPEARSINMVSDRCRLLT